MALIRANTSGGGGSSAFSTPVKVTVPANSTYNISANNVKKIVIHVYDVHEVTFWEDGVITYSIQSNVLKTNPSTSQLNQWPSYASGTITIHSESGSNREVWVTYM